MEFSFDAKSLKNRLHDITSDYLRNATVSDGPPNAESMNSFNSSGHNLLLLKNSSWLSVYNQKLKFRNKKSFIFLLTNHHSNLCDMFFQYSPQSDQIPPYPPFLHRHHTLDSYRSFQTSVLFQFPQNLHNPYHSSSSDIQ